MSTQNKFYNLTEKFFEAFDKFNPFLDTWWGLYRYAQKLESFEQYHIKELKNFYCKYQNLLYKINPLELPALAQVEYECLKSFLFSNLRFLEKTREWQTNPYMYLDLAIFPIYLLAIKEYAPLEKRISDITARLNQTPRLLKEAKRNLSNPPKIYIETSLESVPGFIDLLQKTVLPLARKSPSKTETLSKAVQKTISALKNFESFLKDSLSSASGKFACGEDLFNEILKKEHLLDYTASQLWSLGHQLFKKSLNELNKCAKKINPNKSVKETLRAIKTKHPPADKLVSTYREYMNRSKKFTVQNQIIDIPCKENLIVIETPEFARPIFPYAAYNPPGPFEKKQTGQFWVTPVDKSKPKSEQRAILEEHPFGAIQLTALHEGYPGHHLQLTYISTLKSSILKRTMNNLFVEGWAFYCEQMMKELGYFNKAGELCQLQDQLWRAARIIVDVGLHTERMSFDEAVKFMEKKAGLSHTGSIAEVKRYTQNPTQPLTYFIGKLEIQKIQKDFQKKAGEKFNLKDFHNKLLSCGSIPPKLVRLKLGLD